MRIADEALLCGIILGDGCLSVHRRKSGGSEFRIVVTLNHRDSNLAKIVFELFKKLDPDRRPLIVQRKKWGATEIRMHSKETLYKLNKNWKLPIGLKKNITIPTKFIRDWRLLKYVIKGLFATDGTLIFAKQHKEFGYYPRIEFYSSSQRLLVQVYESLLTRGFKISRFENRLSVNGKESLKKFKKEIGFINDGQIEKLKIYTK